MFRLFRLTSLILVCALLLNPKATVADPKPSKNTALVIGNAAYLHTRRLANPENDAADMAAVLSTLGFDVVKKLNLKKSEIDQVLAAFNDSVPPGSIILFFYAGHGLQINGENFLVPIDAMLQDESSLVNELVKLEKIQLVLEQKAQTKIFFFDACRDNPWVRNLSRSASSKGLRIGRGLAPVTSRAGTLISFSTQPGNVALDGNGRNSPFTQSLVKALANNSDALITDLLMSVRRDVMHLTSNVQIPWETSSLTEKVSLGSERAIDNAETGIAPSQDEEILIWKAIQGSRDQKLAELYLKTYPSGIYAPMVRAIIEESKNAAPEQQRPIQNQGNCNVTGNSVQGTVHLECNQK